MVVERNLRGTTTVQGGKRPEGGGEYPSEESEAIWKQDEQGEWLLSG